ncbi:MAG: HEAT repeat domain-containing protein [Planctomycetota bacterium]|jgi:HEAT repeat protein
METPGKRFAVAGALGVVVVAGALLAKFALDTDDGGRSERTGRSEGAAAPDRGNELGDSGGEGRLRDGSRESNEVRAGRAAAEGARREPEWRVALLKAIDAFEAEGDPAALVPRARDIERFARLLGSAMGAEARDRLLALLVAGKHPVALRSIGIALGESGAHPETARQLQGLFDQYRADREILVPISRALAGTGSTEIAGEMLDRLDLGDRLVALEIVRVAGAIRGAEVERRLVGLLGQDLPAEVRRAIERSWRDARGEATYGALLDELDGAGPDAQVSYIRILATSKDRAHAQRIRQVLDRSATQSVQVAAVQALASIGDSDSVRRVVEIATTRDHGARPEAQRSIKLIRDAAALEYAATRWEELNESGRSGVMMAARRIEEPSQPLLGAARTALSDKSASVRSHAALLLGRPGRDEFVEPLQEFLRGNAHERECLSAVQALRRIGSETAVRAALANVDRIPEGMRESYRQVLAEDLKNKNKSE